MKRVLISAVAAGGVLLGGSLGGSMSALADGEEATAEGGQAAKEVHCIQVNRIRYSKVVDNKTIILFMNGGTDYQMNLARRCPGLKMQKTWIHDAKSTNHLCDVDTIKVPVSGVGNVLNSSMVPCMIDTIVTYENPKKKKPQ